MEEHKKLLLIMNPRSGTMQASKLLADIILEFEKAGYITTVMLTQARNDAREWAGKYAGEYDRIVVSGGDGTFNELVDGVLESGCRPTIGYIPAGSTNDFAVSLGLPKSIVAAAERAVNGKLQDLDIGNFNGRHFSYVASFGAFTSTSYSVPQNLKNILGHAAYMLSGVKDIASIRPIHAKITADPGSDHETIHEDDYLFGAFCNCKSIGGVVKLEKVGIDMNDGLMEVFLVKMPRNLIDVSKIVEQVLSNNLNTKEMVFFSAEKVCIEIQEGTHWSLDGEYEEGAETIDIKMIKSAIQIVK